MTDDWDPNTIPEMNGVFSPCRIYGDDRAEMFALVDQIDYQFLVQWRWSPKWSRGNRKVYLRRVMHEGARASRVQRTLFLHSAVLARMGVKPPTPKHTLIDHRDGNGMNCQRGNLRWATPSMNALNVKGCLMHHEWDI